jgi:hypothetical protein
MSYTCETTIDNGKVNRNGRVYSDELLAQYNASCPKDIRYGDKVVGHMDHVSRVGDRYIAAMTLDEDIGTPPIGIRGVADISEDGECRALSIESIDFIKER